VRASAGKLGRGSAERGELSAPREIRANVCDGFDDRDEDHGGDEARNQERPSALGELGVPKLCERLLLPGLPMFRRGVRRRKLGERLRRQFRVGVLNFRQKM